MPCGAPLTGRCTISGSPSLQNCRRLTPATHLSKYERPRLVPVAHPVTSSPTHITQSHHLPQKSSAEGPGQMSPTRSTAHPSLLQSLSSWTTKQVTSSLPTFAQFVTVASQGSAELLMLPPLSLAPSCNHHHHHHHHHHHRHHHHHHHLRILSKCQALCTVCITPDRL